jgi:hypothetical protein
LSAEVLLSRTPVKRRDFWASGSLLQPRFWHSWPEGARL